LTVEPSILLGFDEKGGLQVVRLASGAVYIFPGDTILLEENLTLKIPLSNTWNAQQIMESIYRLEHLGHLLGAEIIPSHDLARRESLKKSPEAYK
jgi:hypothetical protein